jgi:uncharacterized protein (DUF58 family)
MSDKTRRILGSLHEASQSIAFGIWIVAAISIPAALLLDSYGTALFVVILVVFWQLLAGAGVLLVPASRQGRTRFRYALTPWSILYTGIAGTFCIVSVQWGINLVYLMAAFLLAGAICTGVFPRLMLARTEAEWAAPAHVFAGNAFPVEITLRNKKRFVGAFGLSVGTGGSSAADLPRVHRISQLLPGREHKLTLQQYFPVRGMHTLQPIAVQTAFPFGLLETTMEGQLDGEVLVLPRLGYIHQDILNRHKGGEAKWLLDLRRKDEQGEFRSLREYRHGDNFRHIHWPTSARLKKLYVREFERREMHSLLILLDAYVPAGKPSTPAREERFEKAVSFAATMAAMLAERSVFFAFASYCPELAVLPYDFGAGHFYSVAEALALAKSTPRHSLADLVAALSGEQTRAGGICLITPGPLSPDEALGALGSFAHCSVRIDVSEPEFDEIFTS